MSCELVEFIIESVVCEMREQDFSAAQILQVQQTITPIVTEKTIHTFGGERVYIPKRDVNMRETMMDKFTGNNIAQIAHEMKVSRRTVYNAIKAKRIKIIPKSK